MLGSLVSMMAIASTWSVGPNLQLVWAGSDYHPVGLQTPFDTKLISQAQEAGIHDFNVETSATAPWGDIAQKLENDRFFITLNSALPNATGMVVQPQYYRVNDIRNPKRLVLELPGASKAYVVVALKRDGSVVSQKMFPVQDGLLKADIKAAAEADQIAIIYPIGESLEMEDLWERLDERRDTILRQIRNIGSPAGLRGIINPLGSTPFLASRDHGFVPNSPMFQKEFSDFLDEKYRNLDSAMRAWSMRANMISSFGDLAKLVPLWNGSRGVPQLLNPVTGESHIVEPKRSVYWSDLAESISRTRARRVHRILRSMRKAAAVPILQDWSGWSWFFENPENELTGVSVRLNKFTPSGLLGATAGAMSSNLRSRKPGPLFAVDVPFSPEMADATIQEDMTNYGLRGLFIRSTDPAQMSLIAKMKLPSPQSRPEGLFFPVNSANPAFAQRIQNNLWWLPSPSDGNRIDLGRDISGYEIADGKTTSSYVIWSNGPQLTVDFRLLNPQNAAFRAYNGLPLNMSSLKSGFRMELGPSPVLVTGAAHCPVPDLELVKLERENLALFELALSRRVDISTMAYELRGFKELIVSAPDKALKLAQKVNRQASTLLVGANWVEFESSTENTFSEVLSDAGCSNGACLTLRTPLAEATGKTTASLFVPQRTAELVEVWLAAKIPSQSDRDRLKFRIGGQLLSIRSQPVSLYGDGFGWYLLGSTRLPSVRSEIKAEITGTSSTNIALDALLVTPQTFRPNNVMYPEFLVPQAPKKDPEKGSGD